MSRPKDIDDPLEPSLEQSALDRARAHIAELDAEARLTDETADPAASGDDSAAPPPPAPPTREQADADALAEFQKLRERGAKKTL